MQGSCPGSQEADDCSEVPAQRSLQRRDRKLPGSRDRCTTAFCQCSYNHVHQTDNPDRPSSSERGGLAECLQILIGEDQTTEKGMKLAKAICGLYKTRCSEFKEKYKLNFGVYYTPAENLCYTAMNKFREKYGIIPNVSDREYFTNSIHVPVWKKVTPFEKIDIESQLTSYSSAGCITYVELDSGAKNNIDGLEKIVNYALDKDIPYFAINVPNDMCVDCGYTDELGDVCIKCGSNHIQHLRRVTGYLSGDYKSAFNKGKQAEVKDRVKHYEFNK